MTTFKELQDGLKSLITEKTSPETAESIAKLTVKVDDLAKQEDDLLKTNESLRQKYVEAVKNNSFPDKEQPQEEQPKSLEDCFSEVISKRKR